MGGLALKNTTTRRYQRDEFDVISKELMEMLSKHFLRVAMPLFYKNKQSFGDADIIVSSIPSLLVDGGMRQLITDVFSPNEIFHNGNCWSFDYKELQVDVITVAPENFDAMAMYLSYNDLGNFIGRLAHGLGLKYGQEGLWYEHQFKGKNIGSVTVSQDYPKIYEFLGLDFKRWEAGFDELEDIFEFISTSKFFNWKMFQMDQLNKINRDRNKKRKSYMSFLDWMNKNVADEKHEYQFLEDKTSYFLTINDAFPEADLITQVRRLEYEECKKLYVQSKFNGGQVMLRFGLKDKALGDAITNFKKYVEERHGETFESFVLRKESDFIYFMFKEFLGETSK